MSFIMLTYIYNIIYFSKKNHIDYHVCIFRTEML